MTYDSNNNNNNNNNENNNKAGLAYKGGENGCRLCLEENLCIFENLDVTK